jgi:hypothetical protein
MSAIKLEVADCHYDGEDENGKDVSEVRPTGLHVILRREMVSGVQPIRTRAGKPEGSAVSCDGRNHHVIGNASQIAERCGL